MSEALRALAAFDALAARRAAVSAAGAAGGARELPYLLLDVFAQAPLQGNQLAVVLDASGLESERMQAIALEFGLSETAFVLAPGPGADVAVRIFTPRVELPFAGHPVLGSAVVAGLALGREAVTLQVPAGAVRVRLRVEPDGATYGVMEQPLPTWARFEQERALLDALGVGGALLPIDVYDNGPHHVFVAVGEEREVVALEPDLGKLAELGELGVSCFAHTADGVLTRMFAPALGVAEDPATGSAAGPLAVHLARHGRIDFGETVAIRQGERVGRPSLLHACADGTPELIERVRVGGRVIPLAAGTLMA